MRYLVIAAIASILTSPVPLLAQEAGPDSTQQGPSLRPGDLVEIKVWGQQEYSGTFKVDETGRLPYPVLGDIDVRGKTLREIRTELRTGLTMIFTSPFVTITPQFNIAVLGRVRSPGLFTVDATLTVLDVVAMAGGPEVDGNINGIRLLRDGDTQELGLEASSGRVSLREVGLRSGDQIYVPRKGWTAEDTRLVLGIAQVGLSVAILLVQLGVVAGSP
ncbi:MAG: polysaccharide biosynthesis/export family protein [Gemmatimonadota bacterium]|nr:polysaccharide biosynthesis/export family protein [Gemmatimonadota bacterium]